MPTGWVQSIALCFSQVISIPAQLLIPRAGFFKVIVSGTFMCATGLLMSSFVPSFTYFYLTYGFCFGIAAGMATKPTTHLVLEWVPIQYRMRGTAICTCGGSFDCTNRFYDQENIGIATETTTVRY
ncbi:monocarboxylate transporter 9-like isoform X2 [Anneissia japonica]|uniref:monocarboxylate transporter 9-like isoform X2 n=1 Tax=Anneissia japonica TaxID=1529436 RepID=UPI001425AD60|nr:monocarboxylate transporter 9-like isoform X2 [Anneissia japonica]